jgi:archaemetzincin
MRPFLPFLLILAVLGLVGWKTYDSLARGDKVEVSPDDARALAELETLLAPLAKKLGPPRPGEWLHQHKEPGQTFLEYLQEQPVRRSKEQGVIYLCLIGEFSPPQREVLERTKEYLGIFFDAPVKVTRTLPVDKIPASARRVHPSWGDKQILTTHVLYEVLKPERPDDALAYLAFTASDLWPGEGWNFVYGQASTTQRIGVWSIYRNGDPGRSQADFQRCLKRTLGTASHETGHILTLYHCTVYDCNMNGSNHQEESDRKPLHLCPVCLRKLCWNLRVDPIAYLKKHEAFCRKHGFDSEAEHYRKSIELLAQRDGRP